MFAVHQWKVFLLSLVMFSSINFVSASDFQIETYEIYNSAGLGEVRDLEFDNLGNLYVSHVGTSDVGYTNGSITKIDSSGPDVRWADNIGRSGHLVWAGGTEFGDYLYVSDPVVRKIKRVDRSGNATDLAYVSTQPLPFDIDRSGAYGGQMYTGTWGTDGLYRINANGLVNKFGSFPDNYSGLDSGGPISIQFAPRQNYSGKMYVGWEAWDSSVPSADFTGIYAIETNGDYSLFAEFTQVRDFAFDDSGLMFDNSLFAIGRNISIDEGMHLWRIDEQGNIEDFMRVGWGITDHLTFGPDGAMYFSEYFGDTTEIFRISEIPEPSSLLLLGLGGMMIRKKNKKV